MVRKLKILAVAALAAVAAHAGAIQTLSGTTTTPTGVNGLLVDGTLYNVAFSSGNYLSSYSSPATFLGNQAGANDATVALAAALNSLGVVGLDGLNCAANANPSGGKVPYGCLISTPYDYNIGTGFVSSRDTSWWNVPAPNPNAWIGNHYLSGTSDVNPQGLFPGNADFASQALEYAIYASEGSPTGVPEPASIALIGLGCALLAYTRRSTARRR